MIKDGFYRSFEAREALKHIDGKQIKGDSSIALLFGNRSAGKTVSVALDILWYNYAHRGEKCMLITRTADELKQGYLEKFWSNKIFPVEDADGIVAEILAHDISFTKNVMYIDKDPFCYAESISNSQKVKNSGQYEKCTTLFMDEAVQPGERYMQWMGRTYMERIFEIWQTVARGYPEAVDVTNLVFAANISARDNWLFNDLGINDRIQDNTKKYHSQGIYMEIINNKVQAGKLQKSTMGTVMNNSVSGRLYNEAAQANKYQDNTSFVHKRSLDFNFLVLQIYVRHAYLGVFKMGEDFHMAKIDKDPRSEIITMEALSHAEDIRYELMGNHWLALRDRYLNNRITFQNQETKGLFLEFLGMVSGIVQ